MREFKHPNMVNFECPICKSSKDLPVILVPIPGTENDGICKARQVHSECYELFCKMNDIECHIEKEKPND
jgi:hypothetical protein